MNDETKPTRVLVPGADKGGTWVTMGDKEYKVAPLNFKALRTLAGEIAVLSSIAENSMPTAEQMGVLVKLAHASLVRNYPELPESEVEDSLDFSNFAAVLTAVMGSATPKEPTLLGEAQASP